MDRVLQAERDLFTVSLTRMATLDLAAVTVDCADPAALAAFYRAAAGAEINHEDSDSVWVTLAGMTWIYRRVDGYCAPTWPDPQVPLHFHLEFFVEDLDRAVEELLGHGAALMEPQPNPEGTGLLVLLDPAGRPFCIGVRVS